MNNHLHWTTQFNRFTLIAALLAALMGSAVQVTPAHAASIVVNSNEDTDTGNVNDGKCTLREALIAANTDLPRGGCPAGTIGLDAISFAGNYTITVGSQLPFVTTPITITGNGPANTIIQAHASPNVATWRVFQVTLVGNLTLDGVTVRHGQCIVSCTVVGNIERDGGGGIYNSGTLTITNSLVSENRGSLGGGIFNNGGSLSVINSTISDNNAHLVTTDSDGGGGIRNTGSLTVTNSTISGNVAYGGGGIYNHGALTVTNSIIKDNAAVDSDGGGIYHHIGSITAMVRNSTITGNSAHRFGAGVANLRTMVITDSRISGNRASDGGGISNFSLGNLTITNSIISGNEGGGIDNAATLMVTHSTISGNSADGAFVGGGIRNGGTLSVTNSTISGNSALGSDDFPAFASAGGIYSSGSLTVTSSTISGNTANNAGSGIFLDSGTVSLRNTIVSGNSPANCGAESTTITDDGNNLEDDTTCGLGTSNGSLSDTDPMLGLLANNGGRTKTMALQPGSPAIDAGNDASCPATDQREGVRPQGSHCDIGAYEFGAPATFISLFSDVPDNYWALTFIDRLYEAGITGGCSTTPLNYCPEMTVTRAQMAVFLLRGIHGSTYNPPAVGSSTGFGDVPPTYWAAAWIKQLAAEGITTGCGAGNYCPEGSMTRAQMAVFLLRSKHGAGYNPPPAGSTTGFTDVPPSYWAAAWIKQLVAAGITSGCAAGMYCPEAPVTRAQMAVFLVKSFSLP